MPLSITSPQTKSSVLLTDWAMNIESLAEDSSSALYQLIALSLLYDEIIIPDEIFVLSNQFASWLENDVQKALWQELLSSGPFVLLTHPLSAYLTDDLRELAQVRPIEARAKYIARVGSKFEGKFELNPAVDTVSSFINSCFSGLKRRSAGSVESPIHDIMVSFRSEMLMMLRNPGLRQWRSLKFPT